MRLGELKPKAKQLGWPTVLLSRIAEKLLAALNMTLTSVRATPIDLDRPVPEMPGHIRLKQLDAQDLAAVAGKPGLDLSKDFIDEALGRGDLAFGACDGDKLVAYVWRATGAVPLNKEVIIRFGKPYSYIYKSFTLPSHRGLRLAPNLFRYADRQFMQMGYTHRCAYIDVHNISSLRAARSMGSRALGLAGYVDWFGRKAFFHTPAVKRAGIRIAKRDDSP